MTSQGGQIIGFEPIERQVPAAGTRHDNDIHAGSGDPILVAPEQLADAPLGAVTLNRAPQPARRDDAQARDSTGG